MTKLRAADEELTPAFRMRAVPVLSVVIGSFASALPLIASWPLLPPIGLVLLIAWRLLRPELWPLWIGLPLGLLDDLVSGNPLGTAMMLWTLILIAADLGENQLVWRDYWLDWVLATAAIASYIVLAMFATSLTGGGSPAFAPLLPQLVASAFAFPLALRLCARLDRWRLDL